MTDSKFVHGRTALKVGLQLLACRPGQIILVPDFLCDVVWHPLNKLGLKVATHSINNDLTPNWEEIEELNDREEVFALLMVHYFGQPQDIFKYQTFCRENGVFLIEDNAHGYGGYHNGQPLGSFGNIGFSSPRKFLSQGFGGVLYSSSSKNYEIENVLKQLDIHQYARFVDVIKVLLYRFPIIYSYIKAYRLRNINWSNPYIFQENIKPDYLLSNLNSKKIENVDLGQLAHGRRKLWKEWQLFVEKRGLLPVFSDIHPESSPWAFPAYALDQDKRNYWLKWGARCGVPLFSWPALPDEIIEKNGSALDRWSRMICFPLDGISPKWFIK